MRVWTDGAAHLIASDDGIEVHRSKEVSVLHPVWKRLKGNFPARDVLAVVGHEPLEVWAGTGGLVRLITLENEAHIDQTVDAHVLDAVGLPDRRVLACIAPSGAQEARLVLMEGGEPDVTEAQALALPKSPRIAWPGGIWLKDLVPWPDGDDEDDDEEDDEDEEDEEDGPSDRSVLAVASPRESGGNAFEEVHFSANEHGIAVTSASKGLVVALPQSGNRVDFAVRVPSQPGETEIFAARTPSGVCVVLCLGGQQSAILHIAPDGRVLAHRSKTGREPAWGMGPPVVQGDRVVAFEVGQQQTHRLSDMKLQDLSVTKSLDVGAAPRGRVSMWGAAGGAFILGLGVGAYLGTRDGRGRLSCGALERPRPPARALDRLGAPAVELASGPPSLALAKADAARSWEAAAGKGFTIDIPFTNQGGKSQGIAVEVSGAALQGGLVVPRQVRVGDAEAPLVVNGSAARAELPTVTLAAGSAIELSRNKNMPPPEITVLFASIDLTGLTAGSGILTVRITPLRALPGRGSVLQGKSVTVR